MPNLLRKDQSKIAGGPGQSLDSVARTLDRAIPCQESTGSKVEFAYQLVPVISCRRVPGSCWPEPSRNCSSAHTLNHYTRLHTYTASILWMEVRDAAATSTTLLNTAAAHQGDRVGLLKYRPRCSPKQNSGQN
jgi:hypothetical protein